MSEQRSSRSLRELLLFYARRRGWRTQRRIAMACDLEETALSRFLNGEQDLGARRTHTLFRAVGIPVDDYDLAYELLARAQEQARAHREARRRHGVPAPLTSPAAVKSHAEVASLGQRGGTSVAARGAERPAVTVRYLPPDEDLPTAEVLALFHAEHYTSAQIAAFFGD